MKTHLFRAQNTAAVLALSLCLADSALAAANYDSSVTLNYSVTVLESSNPAADDRTGLSILGTYQQPDDDWSFYAVIGGDGAYQSYSPNPASTDVASVYNGSFAVSGGAEFGSVDTFHTALFGLEFSNSGPYTYSLAVSLDYVLQAAVQGEFANSIILFDYWDDDDLASGFDYVSVATFSGLLHGQQSVGDSVIWSFTLAPGATAGLYAQAGIESHLESASPVPLPGSLWLLFSAMTGLGVIGRRKGEMVRLAPVLEA